MSEPCKCKPNQPVLITIKTCNGNCKSNEGPYPKHDSRPLSASPTVDVPEPEPEPEPIQLPVILPREHGPGCSMEVSVLEKHDPNCRHKKLPNPDRTPSDDTQGSYEVVGRLNFDVCNKAAASNSLKGSKKSFKLQESDSDKTQSILNSTVSEESSKIESHSIGDTDTEDDNKPGSGTVRFLPSSENSTEENVSAPSSVDTTDDGIRVEERTSSTVRFLTTFESTQTPDWTDQKIPKCTELESERTQHFRDEHHLIQERLARGNELRALRKFIRQREIMEQLATSPKSFATVKNNSILTGSSSDEIIPSEPPTKAVGVVTMEKPVQQCDKATSSAAPSYKRRSTFCWRVSTCVTLPGCFK